MPTGRTVKTVKTVKTGPTDWSLPPDTSLRDWLQAMQPDRRMALIRSLGQVDADTLDLDWPSWAHGGQLPPAGDWRTWVIMAGRGFGKTRAGSEWIAGLARRDGNLRIALVAASFEEARAVMIEGTSGLLAVADDAIADWLPTRRLLCFTSGAQAQVFSGASPQVLRGPEHHIAWCDELAKWDRAAETWDMLQLGLRLGDHPRALVTTTPKPGAALRRIMAARGCVVTGGATAKNPHLPAAFVEAVTELYGGTRLGRQELDGELLADAAGALWTVALIEQCRVGVAEHWLTGGVPSPRCAAAHSPSPSRGEGPKYSRTVIGVDPPARDGTCGIVACALDSSGPRRPIGYVLADHSVTARSPEGWARAVAQAAEVHGATLVVAEQNQGGKMVEAVLRAADANLRVRLVTATTGKSARAEPVATLFEAGRVKLAARFPDLEAQLCGMIAGGGYEGPGTSPDRADAMVWALTELLVGKGAMGPRLRVI